MKNEDLGYNAFFESKRVEKGLLDLKVARVISEYKEIYKVKNEEGEYLAKITGKQIFNATEREDYPAVGDWVLVSEADPEQMVIHAVLPRQTILKRKSGDRHRFGSKGKIQIIATNIDVAFVVESVDSDYSLNRFERYFAIAKDGGVEPVIILNKVDLLSKEELDEKLAELKNRFPDIHIILTSTVGGQGLDELRSYIKRTKTYCFLGSSGVGKSSLINKLLGESIVKTGDISSYSGKGKHVTTNRQVYFLQNSGSTPSTINGIVIDNPGMREVGLTDATFGVDNFFDEFAEFAEECKYADCTHTHEVGCAVLDALKSGKLGSEQYENYIKLKKEADHYGANEFEKREKDRKFGKLMKNTKKYFKDLGHKDY